MTDADALILTEGNAFTVIDFETVAEHPLALVPVTVKVVVDPGITTILDEVEPVLHK
jgi:hypothetical protein